MNELTIRIPANLKLPDNETWINRFKIYSETSDRVYTIAQHKEKKYWTCSCPGWITYHKCKHLEAVGLPNHMRIMEVRIAR